MSPSPRHLFCCLPVRLGQIRLGTRIATIGLAAMAVSRPEGADLYGASVRSVAFPPAWDSWAVPPGVDGPVMAGGGVVLGNTLLSPIQGSAMGHLTVEPAGSRGVNVELATVGYGSVQLARPMIKPKPVSWIAPSGAAGNDLGANFAEETRGASSSFGRAIAPASLPRLHNFDSGNDLVSFQTGGDVLQSHESSAVTTIGASGSEFHFLVGFETEEIPAVGSFFDSLTVSLRGSGGLPSVTVATVDAFGITPAPSAPGGLPLDLTSVSYFAAPELVVPTLAHVQTYDVTVVLPQELAKEPLVLTVVLDFFDNQNGVVSKAYVALPTAVPEPGTWVLLGTGLAALVWARRRTS
jgi:hypothetical protein